MPWAILNCKWDSKCLGYILSLNKQRRKLFSSIQTCRSVVNLSWKLLTVLRMINSEAYIKMIFSAVALLTERCFKAGISAINQFRIANDPGKGQWQKPGGWGEDVISFSSLPFSVPCGSMEWGSMKERQPTLHCNLVGHINTGVGGDD